MGTRHNYENSSHTEYNAHLHKNVRDFDDEIPFADPEDGAAEEVVAVVHQADRGVLDGGFGAVFFLGNCVGGTFFGKCVGTPNTHKCFNSESKNTETRNFNAMLKWFNRKREMGQLDHWQLTSNIHPPHSSWCVLLCGCVCIGAGACLRECVGMYRGVCICACVPSYACVDVWVRMLAVI